MLYVKLDKSGKAVEVTTDPASDHAGWQSRWDDCWVADDFATLAEAQAAYADPASMGPGAAAEMRCTAYIMLDGPDIQTVRANPSYRPRRRDNDREWQREIAMQAAMAFGCDGYNDAMGF